MRLFFFSLLILLFHQLSAQEEPKNNKWTVVAKLGSGLGAPGFSTQYNRIAIGANYRISRWFELVGRLSQTKHYHNTNKYLYTGSSLDYNNHRLYNVNTNTKILGLVVGAKLILRIRQGDLAIEGAYGLNSQWQNIMGSNFRTQEFHYAYKATIYTMSNLAISYIYWPNKHFGLSIGLDTSSYALDDLRNTKHLKTDDPVLSYLTDDQQFLLKADAPEYLQFFNLGITYRL